MCSLLLSDCLCARLFCAVWIWQGNNRSKIPDCLSTQDVEGESGIWYFSFVQLAEKVLFTNGRRGGGEPVIRTLGSSGLKVREDTALPCPLS